MRTACAVVVLLAVLGMSGCVKPLPRYRAMEPEAALEVIRQRDGAISCISAEGTVLLSDSEGSSVTLDAAIVAKWPGYLRIRAWKFGQPAFDLTCTPEGLWVFVPDEARRRMGEKADFKISGDQLRRVWGLIGAEFFKGRYELASPKPDSLVVSRTAEGMDGVIIECDIDTRTLTVRSYRFLDNAQHVRQSLKLESYRVIGEGPMVWPRLIAADGESGKITIQIREPEVNGEIPPGAFVPPRRATKQP